MLDEKKIKYRYREYTEEPLNQKELEDVFARLCMEPAELLRKNDKAFKENGLSGNESKTELIKLMTEFPTLLQRPIGIVGKKAVVGRPPERLLELI